MSERKLIIVCGERGCGKTTFINRMFTPCHRVNVFKWNNRGVGKVSRWVMNSRQEVVIECHSFCGEDVFSLMFATGIHRADVYRLSMCYRVLRVQREELYGEGYLQTEGVIE